MESRVNRSLARIDLPPIIGIFLTVFLDLLGFGLFIPDLQLRGASLTESGLVLGFALGCFSLAQLLTAPLLGRISDQKGRRVVLLITTVLSCVAYVLYAHATSIGWMIASRVVSGIAAANLGVAFAYIADVTTPENRAKGMGVVGAAFGLGFIFGPGIGAFLLAIGNNSPVVLGYTGAALSAVNFLYVLFLLPDSTQHKAEAGGHFLENFGRAFRAPDLAFLLVMFFAVQFGFTNLESTFFQLLAAPDWIFHLGSGTAHWSENARDVGALILIAVGLVSVVMQGFLVRILTPRYGEVKLVRYAYVGLVPSLAAVPFLPLWIPILIGIVVMGTCTGLAQPSISALVSRAAPKDMQGGVFGVTQSLGALARFLGPLVSIPLLHWKPFAPYILGALIIVGPAFMAWRLRQPQSEGRGAIQT